MLQEVLVFKTDISTYADRNKVVSLFEGHPEIISLSVDMEDCDRVLRIKSVDLTEGEVMSAVKAAGINCSVLN